MLCYELLSGSKPFSTGDTTELVSKVSSGKLPELPNNIPPSLNPLISFYHSCVSPSYERPSAVEVKRQLGSLLVEHYTNSVAHTT